MLQPQKTLTLSLQGLTHHVVINNEVVIDVTSAKHWFLLSHRVFCGGRLEGNPIAGELYGGLDVESMLSVRPVDDFTPRIMKEVVRFASKDRSIERLVRFLSLKQIEFDIESPLTFDALVEAPETVMTPKWYYLSGEPDLKKRGLIPNGF